jgi:hypothetical protein
MALGFTDDALRDSLGKLATATKDTGEAIDLNALAMDFARLRSISLEEATTLVTKASSGQIGALRRVLPWIDANATATQALAAMQTAAAGAGAAWANTTEGKMARAQIQLGEAMEKLGEVLLPIIATLAELAATILPTVGAAFTTLGDIITGVAQKAADLFDDLIKGIGVVVGSKDAWGDLGRGLSVTGYAFGVIAGNIANGTNNMVSMEGYARSLAGTTAKLPPVFGQVGTAVRGMATAITSTLAPAVASTERAAGTIVQTAGRIPGGIAKALVDGRAKMAAAALALYDAMKKPWTDAMAVSEAIGILHSAKVAAGLRSGSPAAREAAQELWDAARAVLNAAIGDAFDAGTRAGQAFIVGLTGQKGRVRDAVSAPIVEGNKVAGDAFDALLKRAQATLGTGGGGGGGGISGAVDKLAAQLKTRLASAFDTVKDRALAALDRIHTAKLRAIEDARKLRDAELDAQIAALQAPVTAAQAALDAQRAAQRLAELQRSLAEAQAGDDPAAVQAAQAALTDYMAQAEIDRMQLTADAAIRELEAQKKANDDKAAAAQAAEDARYEADKAAFTKRYDQLVEHLTKTEHTWEEANAEILTVLKEFGVDYETVGFETGEAYGAALQRAVQIALDNIKAMVAAQLGDTSTTRTTTTKVPKAGEVVPNPGEARAAGGPVYAGSPYVVGERGRELFVPGMSGAIVPNGGFGGASSVNISVNVSGAALFDPYGVAAQQIADALVPGMKRALARNGMTLA